MTQIKASVITASDGAADDEFSYSVSLSGDSAIVGAVGDDDSGDYSGSAYYFKGLDSAGATATENVKLTALGGAIGDYFGSSVSLFGDSALVGAYGSVDSRGTAYYFKDLDSAGATATQNVTLTALGGDPLDKFGASVSLSGDSALVGAWGDDDTINNSGSAYYYKDLGSAGATATQDVKLKALGGGVADDYFGLSVSLSGDSALVGAYGDDDTRSNSGAAYYYKDLDSAGATATQNVKLKASDRDTDDYFGTSVSLFGDNALIGAYGDDSNGLTSGSAYYYKDLDLAGATATQDVKLTASDGSAGDYFGLSVSLSGDSALVGARGDNDNGSDSGSAYYYMGLDSAGVWVKQNVKLTASDGVAGDAFGYSVSLSGDNFVIGASYANSNTGKAYTGTISSFTTLDAGSASRTISGISFVSQTDWIVGSTTSGNAVTLSSGDSASVTTSGMAVYIGRNAGSDNNTLNIAGTLDATDVYIGSIDGNTGNVLQFESTAVNNAANIYLASRNTLSIYGDYTAADSLTAYLTSNGTTLYAQDVGASWSAIDATNYDTLLSVSIDGSYTLLTAAVPEPATYTLFGGLGALGLAIYRRRKAGR
ncbi:MAG: FG-GAP repeat protein [Opitutales bacterium]